MSKALERSAPSVPALAPTPATTITAEDVAVPRLYVGQYQSEAVREQRVKFGDVFLATGADDTEPQVLWHLNDGNGGETGVLFHVLHLRKAKSWAPAPGAPLERFDFEDPNAPADAWTTYNYTLCLPEVAPDMPAKLLLTKTSRSVAQKINTLLMRNAAAGPSYGTAFRLYSAKRKNDKGEFCVFQADAAQAAPEHVKQAAELFELIRPGLEERRPAVNTGEQPEI